MTLAFGSRVYVKIPRVRGQISVSDAFVSLMRITKKKMVMGFNAGVYVYSTFLTVVVLRATFGDIQQLPTGDQSTYISPVCVMVLVQYVINSGLVATGIALRSGLPSGRCGGRTSSGLP